MNCIEKHYEKIGDRHAKKAMSNGVRHHKININGVKK